MGTEVEAGAVVGATGDATQEQPEQQQPQEEPQEEVGGCELQEEGCSCGQT